MIFIFPLWWWSVPGMLKGWIDRVMSYGWAWLDPTDPHSGSLSERKILVMLTAGASHAQLAKRSYDKALETQLNIGTWDYCGFRDVTTRVFDQVTGEASQNLLTGYLKKQKNSHSTRLSRTVSVSKNVLVIMSDEHTRSVFGAYEISR